MKVPFKGFEMKEHVEFDQNFFNTVVKRAMDYSCASGGATYLVRYNKDPGKKVNFGYLRESALDIGGMDATRHLYNNADLVFCVCGNEITIIRDCLGTGWDVLTQAKQFLFGVAGQKAAPKATPVFELPWQKREREAAEKEVARVALRNNVRSTLGM